MNRPLMTLCAVACLGALGSGLAAPNPYVFGSSGANLGFGGGANTTYSLSLGLGTGNVFDQIGARAEVLVAGGGNTFASTLEGNLVLPFPQRDLNPYIGAGASFGIISGASSTQTAFGVQGLLGTDFQLTRGARAYLEVVPAYGFNQGVGFTLSARAGLKINL